MPIQNLTPYLFFDGTAEKAIRLYERALGAETEALQRYGDRPSPAEGCRPEHEQRVMHASLRLGKAPLMISDLPSERSQPSGSNVQVCLDFDEVDEMTRKFEALAETGNVVMALHDAFWGARFGMLVDEFGIHWMFSCPQR